jgi:ATP-dependent Zn protease
MVTEFGMSDELGVVSYDGHKRAAFIENPFGTERGNYAEDTAQKIDREVKRILNDAHETALRYGDRGRVPSAGGDPASGRGRPLSSTTTAGNSPA